MAESKAAPRICARCGANFQGKGPAKYCPSCKPLVVRENNYRAQQRFRSGEALKRGKTVPCAVCGAPFTRGSGRQHLCAECARRRAAEQKLDSFRRARAAEQPPSEEKQPPTKRGIAKRIVSTGDRSGYLEAVEYVDGQLRCICHKCGRDYMVRPGYFKRYSECRVCRRYAKRIKIGQVYNNAILVLERTEERYRDMDYYYRCRCLLCGKEKILRGAAIRKNRSCGCRPADPADKQAQGAAGAAATVGDSGTQLYVATRETANRGNTTGYRWVHVLHREDGREWIFASFMFRHQKYYKGGFDSRECAYEWALK